MGRSSKIRCLVSCQVGKLQWGGICKVNIFLHWFFLIDIIIKNLSIYQSSSFIHEGDIDAQELIEKFEEAQKGIDGSFKLRSELAAEGYKICKYDDSCSHPLQIDSDEV